jgi:hypothetical protein
MLSMGSPKGRGLYLKGEFSGSGLSPMRCLLGVWEGSGWVWAWGHAVWRDSDGEVERGAD